MAFLVAPTHPLARSRKVGVAELREANLLVRERGSGTRSTIERLFKDAGLGLRIGSEMNSNEALKQMAVAGLGVAFLLLHTCMLELEAGLLQLVSTPGNPIVREWFVMHLADKAPPPVAAAFREYLIEHGQLDIDRQLRAGPAAARRKAGARRAAAAPLK